MKLSSYYGLILPGEAAILTVGKTPVYPPRLGLRVFLGDGPAEEAAETDVELMYS